MRRRRNVVSPAPLIRPATSHEHPVTRRRRIPIRQQLDAMRALQTELRAENELLREAVARKLGQRRAGATDDQ